MQPLVLFLAFTGLSSASFFSCKCTPTDACWSKINWDSLNSTVSGKLILNTPPAISCYPGPAYNEEECMYVYSQWYNTTFQSAEPIGYSYPIDDNCPVVDLSSGEQPGNCTLGSSPVYSINATEVSELAAGIAFAQKNNVRLVVRNTGHDLLGKSTGYGSLQIWMKYLQKGITYQSSYKASDSCTKSGWTGDAFKIAGGYVWKDVYAQAFPRNLTVVGGGDPTVGVIGGYIQGGGHSPAAHDYGLAADQILEATVILADGSVVTASPCSNSDLYYALRGGGGGTYGVVTSMSIKAYPSEPVVAQSLVLVPLTSDMSPLLEAVTDIYMSYPGLVDAGFSGYGTWSINSPLPLFGDATLGYVHAVAAKSKSLAQAQADFAPLLQKMAAYNGTSLFVSSTWIPFPSYPAYYTTLSGGQQLTGSPNSALTSRMFDKAALTSSRTALRSMIGTIAGTYEEATINSVELVGGGKVLQAPALSGVNPAWRSTYMVNVVARGWADGSSAQAIQDVKNDITYTKNGAMRALTPFTGSYLNEADRNNPLWAIDYYGVNYLPLRAVKQKYDPSALFYCPTCVGSPSWYQRYLTGEEYGPLCPTGL